MNTSTARLIDPATKLVRQPASLPRGWRWWLVPDTSTLLASVLYGSILVLFQDQFFWGLWRTGRADVVASLVGPVLLLAVADRADVYLFGQQTSQHVGIALVVIRLTLVGVVYQSFHEWYTPVLLLVVPFFAARHFETRGLIVVSLIVWLLFGVAAWPTAPRSSADLYVLVMLSFLLLVSIAAGAGKLSSAEERSRQKAWRLLAILEQSHVGLRTYAAGVLAATDERHRLAREIHDQLGQGLAAISVQLDLAIAIRAMDPDRAERAVHSAKQAASECLQNVRHSVGALRASEILPKDHRIWQEWAEMGSGPVLRRGWVSWLFPRPFDLVQTVLLLGFLAISVGWSSDRFPLWSWPSAAMSTAVLGLILVDRVAWLRFRDAPALMIWLALIAVRLALFALYAQAEAEEFDLAVIFLAIAQYSIYTTYRGTLGWWALALGWVLSNGLYVWSDLNRTWPAVPPTLTEDVVSMALLSAFVLLSTQMMLNDRTSGQKAEALIADLKVNLRQFQAYAEQALATNEERNHLAREIHDGLGHYLTVINVQLEKALAFRTVDPTVADQAIRDTRRLVGEALREVRGSLNALALAPDGFDLPVALRQLVGNLSVGTKVDLQVQGCDEGYAPQSLLVLYRVAQEGLTNVQKHARASAVRVALTFGTAEASLEVCDDGNGFEHKGPLSSAVTLPTAPPHLGASYGLRGVRERVDLIGGELVLASAPGRGTRLCVVVPKHLRPNAGIHQNGSDR